MSDQFTDMERAAVIVTAAVLICAAILVHALLVSGATPVQLCRDSHGRPGLCAGVRFQF